MLHDCCFSAEGPYGESSPYDLSEARQIRIDAIKILSAPIGHPEARDHLIEDEHDTCALAQLCQAFQKSLLGRYHTHIAHDGLDDNTRYIPVLADDALHAIEMV